MARSPRREHVLWIKAGEMERHGAGSFPAWQGCVVNHAPSGQLLQPGAVIENLPQLLPAVVGPKRQFAAAQWDAGN
jgi:hypothetical protein